MFNPFNFACPLCHTRLEFCAVDELFCPCDRTTYKQVDGIWRFLSAERATYLEPFIREYATVRQAEGRGASNSDYYRALPFRDLTGRFSNDWHIRATSFRALLRVIEPSPPLTILDLGAGNGWLSYRLAQREHLVGAVDLQTNARDGLGAHVHYHAPFVPIQAEFDHLPLAEQQIDLAIFNSAFHYSTRYETTLGEILRVLKPRGRVVILDTPIYHDAGSGEQMVRERQAQFQRAHGFPSNAIKSENYLTYARLAQLARALNLRWQFVKPFYGWRWMKKSLIARVRGTREPAQFMLVIGQRC